MRVLAFAASLRHGSTNKKLIKLATRLARAQGVEVDLADFREFDMPLYDGDLEADSGLPAGAVELSRRIEQADCIMISSPEYNYSMPGILKNALDWVSVGDPNPLERKFMLLLSASSSVVGGARGLLQLRIPLTASGVLIHPESFSLGQATKAFDDDGMLVDSAMADRLRRVLMEYFSVARALKAQEPA